ncbi:MAG: TetR/AcrR family transcriptional regulator [Pseudomonadota bacterium]
MSVVEQPSRTRRRKAARPGEIVAAGIEEFAEHGFERARLDRIAAKAGIAKGTIYLYFPSKEALFLAAVEEHVISVMAENELTLQTFEGSTEDLLRVSLKSAYAKMLSPENQAVMRILISESHRLPDMAQTYHDMAIKRGSALLAGLVERGIARGELRESAATQTPELLIAPIMFACLHNMTFQHIDPLDIDEYFEGHIEMIMRGIGKV